MRVPLRVELLAGGVKPFLYMTVRISQFHILRPLRMFIDTGSPWTIVSERDSELMQIPFTKLHEKRTILGIGGGSVIGYAIKDAVISFRDEEEKLVHKTLSLMYAVRTEKKTKEMRKRVFTFPSILGVDFLTEHKYRLVFDPANEVAWLET